MAAAIPRGVAFEVNSLDLDAVLAHMPAPLVVLRVGTRDVIYANEAAKRMPFAYGDVAGWVATDVHGVELAPEALPHSEAHGGQSFDGRFVRFRNGGRQVALRFHCHLLADSLCVLTFDDVTSLDTSQRELRDALQSRDDLVSMAAHELRSPLGALTLIAERLHRRAQDATNDRDEMTKIADAAIRQTRRLNVLVSNLLDVSRIRAGKFELDLEESSLGEIVKEACEPLVEQARSVDIAVACNITDPAVALWDRARMEQVIVNLVTNAIKYGKSPIVVHLGRIGNEAELVVSDAGPGIPPERQSHIFEQFARADSRHRAQSLGLGLFIVREIITAHGGTIRLSSRPGLTEFVIRLPIREQR